MFSKPVLMFSGTTAGGKSSAAVRAAVRFGGEVITLDSVQLYRDCHIGSAKISEEEREGVVHHLLDLLSPTEQASAGKVARAAWRAVEDIQSRGRLAVVVGGTPLYVTSFLYGLADLPLGDRQRRAELEEFASDKLYSLLELVDPDTAKRLSPEDRIRIIRALEVYESSGSSQSAAVAAHSFLHTRLDSLIIVLVWRRDVLQRRIAKRTEIMIQDGLVAEVVRLREQYGDNLWLLKSIGYREANECVQGIRPGEVLSEAVTVATRRLAKRQMTFWRNEPRKRDWIVRPSPDEPASVLSSDVAKLPVRRQVKDFRVMQMSWEELCERAEFRLSEPFVCPEVWYVDAEGLGM